MNLTFTPFTLRSPLTILAALVWLSVTSCDTSSDSTQTGSASASEQTTSNQSPRAYEMRIYTASEGKLEELENRFRNYTMRLFEEHGIENIGYWIPDDPERAHNTLIYIISYESREVAQERWDSFFHSPEWREISARTNANGNLVHSVESVFLTPTDYSPLQ